MKLAFIENQASRSGSRATRQRAEAWVSECRALGHEVELVPTTSAADVAPAILEVRQSGFDRLLLVGGDGLIHAALPALAGSGFPVGILPNGTGNDIARAFRLGRKAALKQALGPTNHFDLLRVDPPEGGPLWAASVVTIGFSGRVAARAGAMAWPKGSLRYTAATLAELRSLEVFPATITFDGVTERRLVTMIAIGNTAFFGGGMRICPGASAADGLIDVVVVGDVGPASLAAVLPTSFIGQHIRHPKVEIRRCERVVVSMDETAWADGEHLGCSELEVRAEQGSLHLAADRAAMRR